MQLTKDAVTPDEIFAMIAAEVLYVDWRAAPLAEPSRVKVFATSGSAMVTKHDGGAKPVPLSIARLQCGSQITWDGRLWKVVNLGETSVSLLSEDQKLAELPVAAFQSLVSDNRLIRDLW